MAEKIELTDRLKSIDHFVVNQIKEESKVMDYVVLQNVEIPDDLRAPFALFFTDGEMALFWTESKEERQKWVKVFKKLIIEPAEENSDWTVYQMRTKNNAFLTTLYTSLIRNSDSNEYDDDHVIDTINNNNIQE